MLKAVKDYENPQSPIKPVFMGPNPRHPRQDI